MLLGPLQRALRLLLLWDAPPPSSWPCETTEPTEAQVMEPWPEQCTLSYAHTWKSNKNSEAEACMQGVHLRVLADCVCVALITYVHGYGKIRLMASLRASGLALSKTCVHTYQKCAIRVASATKLGP